MEENPTAAEILIKLDFENIPGLYPDINILKLPMVRQVGIKACIQQLAEHFGINDYKFNYLQFWFLDMLTDCLWRLQDEFNLPEPHQKIVLKWILHAFAVIRAGDEINVTRKKLLKHFADAMLIVEESTEAGPELLPSPSELQEKQELKSYHSLSLESGDSSGCFMRSSSVTDDGGTGSFIALKVDNATKYFKLPKPVCMENEPIPITQQRQEEFGTNLDDATMLEKCRELYKPDTNVPSRFLPGDEPLDEQNFGNSGCIFKEKSISQISFNEERLNQARYWINLIKTNENHLKEHQKNILINKSAILAIKQIILDIFYSDFQFTIICLSLNNRYSAKAKPLNIDWCTPKLAKGDVKKAILKKYYKSKIVKKPKGKKGKEGKKGKKGKKGKGKKGKKEKKPKRTKSEQLRLKLEAMKKLILPLKEAITKDYIKELFEKKNVDEAAGSTEPGTPSNPATSQPTTARTENL